MHVAQFLVHLSLFTSLFCNVEDQSLLAQHLPAQGLMFQLKPSKEPREQRRQQLPQRAVEVEEQRRLRVARRWRRKEERRRSRLFETDHMQFPSNAFLKVCYIVCLLVSLL